MTRNEGGYSRAKAFLEQVQTAQKRVETLEERIGCIGMMLGIKTPRLTDVKVKSSPDLQKNERLIVMKADLEWEKAEAEAEARRIRADAEVMIGRISDPRSQKVMILYYLYGKKLAETAEECDYSKRQIIRLRDAGLEELENLLQSLNEKVVIAMHQNEPA